MEKKELTALVYKEEDLYVARCKELLITEVGNSEEEVISKLRKTIEEYSKKFELKILDINTSKYFDSAKEIKFQVTLHNRNVN